MSGRRGRPFYPLENTTAPSFNTTALESVVGYVLESTIRVFQGPSNRAVRIANISSAESFYVKFGSSTVLAASSDSLLVLGSVPFVADVYPSQTYVSFVSSTTTIVNVTLGYGG